MISCLWLDETANCTNKEIIKFLTCQKIKSIETFLQKHDIQTDSYNFLYNHHLPSELEKRWWSENNKLMEQFNYITNISIHRVENRIIVPNNEIWFAHDSYGLIFVQKQFITFLWSFLEFAFNIVIDICLEIICS